MNNLIGKKVILRANGAGVFYGTLSAKEGSTALLTNARKIYRWAGSLAVEDLAAEGPGKPRDCKITSVNSEIEIENVLQINVCTDQAISVIESIPVWKN